MTNDKQGDLFYSVGQRGKLSAKTNAVEKKEEDVGEKMKMNGSGRCMQGSILTSGFKGRTTHSNSGFSTEGTLTSASAVPHCTSKRKKTDPNDHR